jgi:hypothetical protein
MHLLLRKRIRGRRSNALQRRYRANLAALASRDVKLAARIDAAGSNT